VLKISVPKTTQRFLQIVGVHSRQGSIKVKIKMHNILEHEKHETFSGVALTHEKGPRATYSRMLLYVVTLYKPKVTRIIDF